MASNLNWRSTNVLASKAPVSVLTSNSIQSSNFRICGPEVYSRLQKSSISKKIESTHNFKIAAQVSFLGIGLRLCAFHCHTITRVVVSLCWLVSTINFIKLCFIISVTKKKFPLNRDLWQFCQGKTEEIMKKKRKMVTEYAKKILHSIRIPGFITPRITYYGATQYPSPVMSKICNKSLFRKCWAHRLTFVRKPSLIKNTLFFTWVGNRVLFSWS